MNISLSVDVTDKINVPKVFMLKDLVTVSHISGHRDLKMSPCFITIAVHRQRTEPKSLIQCNHISI